MSSSSSSSSSTAGETLNLNLIPGLPDDIGALILASIPFSHHARLKPTSKSWRDFLSSPSLLSLRRPCHHLVVFPQDPSLASPYLFDPSTLAWAQLPPIPCSPHSYGRSNFSPISLGRHLYVLGGSHFDARSYPIGHPTPYAAVHRLDLSAPAPLLAWARLPDMLIPRGSFACAAVPSDGDGSIIVAGGGSRHTMFPSSGSRMSSVERYSVGRGEWRKEEGLPRYRAGCVGCFLAGEEEEEFWVMGGYGDYRTVSGVFPADVYYRDAVVLGLRSGKWREVGEMWEEGERWKLGAIVAVDGVAPGIFMLDQNDIFRYDITLNRWLKETSLRRKLPADEARGFVAMDGELHVLTSTTAYTTTVDARAPKKRTLLEIQVYNPKKRKWRFINTNSPFHQPLDFKITKLCTIRL